MYLLGHRSNIVGIQYAAVRRNIILYYIYMTVYIYTLEGGSNVYRTVCSQTKFVCMLDRIVSPSQQQFALLSLPFGMCLKHETKQEAS
jgi:hypothetical protein